MTNQPTAVQAAAEAAASTARLATFMHDAAQKTADQLATLRALQAKDPVVSTPTTPRSRTQTAYHPNV